MTTKQQHHFFASSAFGWGVGNTVDEAVAQLVKATGVSSVSMTTRNAQKNGAPGLYFWHCKVLAPKDAEYDIEWFMPKDIKWEDGRHCYFTYCTKKEHAYWEQPADGSRRKK